MTLRSDDTRHKMSESAKRAWRKRKRMFQIGDECVRDGRTWVRTQSIKGWYYWRLKDGETHHKARMFGVSNPFYGKTHSDNTIARLRLASTGRRMSEETRRKLSHARKGRPKTLEWKRKIGDANRVRPLDMRSSNQAEKARVRASAIYREWRNSAFHRDDYTCQHCGARNGRGREIRLEAHHVKSYTHYPEVRFDVSNGLTLCYECHQKENRTQMIGNTHGLKRNQTAPSL